MKSLRTYLLHLLWWIQYPFGHFMKMHDRELLVMNLNNLSNILERSCNFVCINIFNNNIISVLRKCHLLMSADVRSCNRRQTSRNITFRRWSYTDLYINLNTCRPIPCRPILGKKSDKNLYLRKPSLSDSWVKLQDCWWSVCSDQYM